MVGRVGEGERGPVITHSKKNECLFNSLNGNVNVRKSYWGRKKKAAKTGLNAFTCAANSNVYKSKNSIT